MRLHLSSLHGGEAAACRFPHSRALALGSKGELLHSGVMKERVEDSPHCVSKRGGAKDRVSEFWKGEFAGLCTLFLREPAESLPPEPSGFQCRDRHESAGQAELPRLLYSDSAATIRYAQTARLRRESSASVRD